MSEGSLVDQVKDLLERKSVLADRNSYGEANFHLSQIKLIADFVNETRRQAMEYIVVDGENQNNYEIAQRAITLLRHYPYSKEVGKSWQECRHELLNEAAPYPDWIVYEPDECTTVLVFNIENQIALAKKIGSDYYQAPGGKREGQETLYETGQRELVEETGLFLPLDAFIHRDSRKITSALTNKTTVLHTIRTRSIRSTDKLRVTEPEKNQEWFWASPDDALKHYKLLPGLRAVLEEYFAT